MKNYSRIIDLGKAECTLRRVQYEEIHFDFWLREEDEIGELVSVLCPTVKSEFPYYILNALFDGSHEEELIELARKAYELVKSSINLVDDTAEDGVRYSFTGPSLEMLRPPSDEV